MSTINGKPFSTPRNVNLRGGILRFDVTQASNPLDSSSNGIYINASNQLIFSAQGSTTILGAAGAGGATAPSLDQIFQGDQTLDLAALSTLTIDRSSGNNDVLTITNTGAGSGDCIQITNVGTGNDIEGTSDTWHFSKAGDMTCNKAVMAGDAGSDSLTLTAGDVVFSDGAVAITDADNAASLTVTNNTATSASMVVIAGSGTFTGSTTTSFMTITPSGLTTGTAVYLPLAALTTGIGLHIVGNALTTGQLIAVSSSGAGTQITGAGRLFSSDHTGANGGSATLNEFKTASVDESILLSLTASAALALGKVLYINASSMTTGSAITIAAAAATTGALIAMTDLGALTTGQAISIAHATSVIADTGSLIRATSSGINTGGATNGTVLDLKTTGQLAGTMCRVDSIQTTGTVMSIISTGVMTTTGNLLTLTANSATTAVGLLRINGNALTAGYGEVIASSSTALTTGRLLLVNHSGNATATANCAIAEVASAATENTTIFKVTGSAALAAGTGLEISLAAMTTGIGLSMDDMAALTTGVGISLAHATSVIADTGSMVRIASSGINTGGATNGTMLDIKSTGQVAGTEVRVDSINVTGTVISVIGTGVMTTTGNLMTLTANSATTAAGIFRINGNALTSGIGAVIASSSTGLTGAGRLLYVSHSGNATAATTAKIVEFASAAADDTEIFKVTASAALAAGMAVNISAVAMTTGTALAIKDLNALTTGTAISVISNSADVTARNLVYIKNDNAAAVGAVPLQIENDAVQGTGSKFKRAIRLCGFTIWVSIDGTSPNGALTGDNAGDLCLNAATSKPLICTGTNVWAAVA